MASFGFSEPPEIEQIITEFFAKSLHIVLESRSPCVSSRNFSGDPTISSPSSSSSSSSSMRPRDKWFRLALRDCPAALENIDFWRQSNLEPMVVDVILVQRPIDCDPINWIPRRDLVRNTSSKEHSRNSWGSEQDDFRCLAKNEQIIERWIVQYESRKSSSLGSKRSSNTTHNLHKIQHTLYKKSILLLRSLYLMVRLLPGYKLFRDLNSSQIHAFTLAHRVSSIIEPFTRREEAEMQRFCFTPVDTSCGRLCLSVSYRASLSDVSSEPPTPMSPQVIANYVGSPMADPLKRFPSLPMTCSPSSAPFSRRHSWGYDLYRASPPSVSFSPSPTHSESRASVSNPASRRFPPMSLPPHPPEMSSAHHKNTGFDEYWPSPTFSPPPYSASPPSNTLGCHLPKSLLRSESAPVSIPATEPANTPVSSYKNDLPPSLPLKVTGCTTSRTDKGTRQIRAGMTVDKMSIGKDEIGKISGLKISSSSSQPVTVSRTSSRLSLPDDFDSSEFICPFITDDDDVADSYSRPESYDHKRYRHEPLEPGGVLRAPKSQGAEVGALVLMLKTASPLCQDFSSSTKSSQAPSFETWNNSIQPPDQSPAVQDATSSRVASSGVVFSKTTADALKELESYKNMKTVLIKKGLSSQTLTNLASAAEVSGRGTTR